MTSLDRRAWLAGGGALALAGAARAQAGRPPRWKPRAALPWAVQEIYACVADGMVVTGGGLAMAPDGLRIEDRVGLYDPAADRWREGPPLPAPRHHPMFVGDARGRPWAIGGFGRGPGGDWSAMTEAWVLEAEAWRPGPALPRPLCESVGAELGGRLHLVTGRRPAGEANGRWEDHADVADHWVLDPDGGRWETARPAPMARNSAAGAVLDGILYVAGGRTVNGGGVGRLDRYDPAVGRWDTLAPIPPSPATGQQVGGGLAMGVLDGRLVAFGGEWFGPGRGGGVFAETWIYDPAADAWRAGPPMRTPRHGLAAASADGQVLAIAGGATPSGGQAVGVVEAFVA